MFITLKIYSTESALTINFDHVTGFARHRDDDRTTLTMQDGSIVPVVETPAEILGEISRLSGRMEPVEPVDHIPGLPIPGVPNSNLSAYDIASRILDRHQFGVTFGRDEVRVMLTRAAQIARGGAL